MDLTFSQEIDNEQIIKQTYIMPDGDKCHGKKKLVKRQRITVGGGGVCYYRQNSI